MPQALKPLCLIQFLVKPFYSFLASGVIRNWHSPVWSQKLEIFGTKSAKQAPIRPVWMPWALKPLCLIQFLVNPFFSLSVSGVIRNWHSPVWMSKVGNFLEQNQLYRLRLVKFKCLRYWNPCVSFNFGWIPFPMFCPCSFLPPSLWGNKKWFIMGGWLKRWNHFRTFQFSRLQMVLFECSKVRNHCVSGTFRSRRFERFTELHQIVSYRRIDNLCRVEN